MDKTIKIKMAKAVSFLIALGFKDVETWPKAKIVKALQAAPEKVKKAPKGFGRFLKELKGAKVIQLDSAEEAAPPTSAAPAKKPAAKKKEEAPAKKKVPVRKSPATNGPVPRDAFGNQVGTIAATVNAVMSDEWMSAEEIAEKAGVTLDQARGRLYWGKDQEAFEYRSLIQFRIKK